MIKNKIYNTGSCTSTNKRRDRVCLFLFNFILFACFQLYFSWNIQKSTIIAQHCLFFACHYYIKKNPFFSFVCVIDCCCRFSLLLSFLFISYSPYMHHWMCTNIIILWCRRLKYIIILFILCATLFDIFIKFSIILS